VSAVAFSGVSKQYGSLLALDHLDLSLEAGETVALLGPNGAGKSTSINLLLGLLHPDSGSVSVLDRSPAQALRAGSIGAMLQAGAGNSLPSLASVGEVIDLVRACYPRSMARQRVLELAHLDDVVNQRVEHLSGGQAQRVRFAVAICGQPDLVILDEPTVGMDVESRRSFWAVMREFASIGTTILFATHYLDEADAIADRILVMARGRLVADGTGSEIKARASGRTVRFSSTAERDWTRLVGVERVEVHGREVMLLCTDADEAVRALVTSGSDFQALEVTGADLEQAFVALTEEPV
jgi:ABC-2 type transport system ATP-binding protein